MKYFSAILAAVVLFFNSAADAKFKYAAPQPTTEFEQMAYAPVYPTYSWEPLPNTEFYLVQVLNSEGKIIREMMTTESLSRVTDWQPFTEVGEYYWRVCVVDKHKKPLSDWSEKKLIQVTAPVAFAALGDSITHGGANFIPAGQLACQWETFCEYPIKNIGRSGDTTAMMIERFERDVLPFSPKVLLIMGGVNDIREGKTADEVIANLKVLRDKCLANDIVPVLCTITPMNTEIMIKRGIPLANRDWRFERAKINKWIMQDKYSIDCTGGLENHASDLRAGFTTDGLHPNLLGKMLMGKAIEKSLRESYFNFITGVVEE